MLWEGFPCAGPFCLPIPFRNLWQNDSNPWFEQLSLPKWEPTVWPEMFTLQMFLLELFSALHYILSREKLYTPPPPPPIFWPKGIFRGGGWGCIFCGPTRQEFYTPPPFIHPPTPRRVFSGEGGWGCIKFGPVFSLPQLFFGWNHYALHDTMTATLK